MPQHLLVAVLAGMLASKGSATVAAERPDGGAPGATDLPGWKVVAAPFEPPFFRDDW